MDNKNLTLEEWIASCYASDVSLSVAKDMAPAGVQEPRTINDYELIGEETEVVDGMTVVNRHLKAANGWTVTITEKY